MGSKNYIGIVVVRENHKSVLGGSMFSHCELCSNISVLHCKKEMEAMRKKLDAAFSSHFPTNPFILHQIVSCAISTTVAQAFHVKKMIILQKDEQECCKAGYKTYLGILKGALSVVTNIIFMVLKH